MTLPSYARDYIDKQIKDTKDTASDTEKRTKTYLNTSIERVYQGLDKGESLRDVATRVMTDNINGTVRRSKKKVASSIDYSIGDIAIDYQGMEKSFFEWWGEDWAYLYEKIEEAPEPVFEFIMPKFPQLEGSFWDSILKVMSWIGAVLSEIGKAITYAFTNLAARLGDLVGEFCIALWTKLAEAL